MPPKKAAATSTSVYIVLTGTSIDSVHASVESANERVSTAKEEGKDSVKIEVQKLIGGSISVEPVVEETKPAKTKVSKSEAPKANTAAKKTKTPAEQRAANADKPKGAGSDADLPDDVKALLAGEGAALDGLRIVVTGVPPTLGRKNAEKLVTNYGGNLTKSLSKNTSFVVVGNDAGPTK